MSVGKAARLSYFTALFAHTFALSSVFGRLRAMHGIVPFVLLTFAISMPVRSQTEALTCVMDPAQLIDLSSAGTGVLSEIFVARGDPVYAGQAVAQMDGSLERAAVAILEARAQSTAQVERHEARVAFVSAQLDRMRLLVAQNTQSAVRLEELEYEHTLAQIELQQALIDRASTEAELDRARLAYDKTLIVSPIDGLIVDIPLGPGEGTGHDRPVMTIAQLDPLHVEAFLPIDLFAMVQPGMPVIVEPDAPIGGSYSAEISVVDRVFDPASRTFGIRVALSNPGSLLPAGHRCRLVLSIGG